MYLKKTICDVSIVIPVYNCEEKILIAINKIKEALSEWIGTYELIVVNDGSTDKTLSFLQAEYGIDPSVRIFSDPKNKGKGHAVKTGVLASSGSKCVFIDGDMDISPKDLRAYLVELEDFDMVVASKLHKLSRVNATKGRKFLSRAFAVFVRASTGIPINDTQSGLKGGNSDLLKKIFEIMSVSRYAFDVELLVIASKAGLKIKEMPVEMTLKSKFKVKEIVRMLYDVLRISSRYRFKNGDSYRYFMSLEQVIKP